MKFILGLKIGMSQIFDKEGRVIPVTLIEAGPCQVTQIKKGETDGYTAVQIGFKKIEKKKTTTPPPPSRRRRTPIKKTMKKKPFRYLRELRNAKDYKIGDEILASVFKEGDRVLISGISKGRGFAGVVKRWGFAGLPKTHGTKHGLRKGGAIGSSYPQRVVKGKKMAGRMGSARVTVKNLKVVKVDSENNLLAVRGAVPGRRGTLLEIRG
ncbi:50S ribosomal protein L3 [Patescibacteria group bacterium]|nr:50S ribosomal protein L3 [Patescibacteria group bacterium]